MKNLSEEEVEQIGVIESDFILDSPSAMATSYLRGLGSLIRLFKARKTSETKDLYKSTSRIWKKAKSKWSETKKQNKPNFNVIFIAERNMRKNFLRFIFESTARYGNTETKRVYDWHSGTVGTLNQLFNFAGARLRDTAIKLYPFPLPVKKGRWGYYYDVCYGR
ncbi:MAG: hypothetical protein IH840_15750, partial [Candidatus Heimdallarchaeota archaeon]|nr:hypothetical protein [Candidatus Heimdallarchaeota archaeon]